MSLEEIKYDAFISYRHTELDKFVAENVHKQLEAFRLPKSAEKNSKKEKKKINRVFRDQDELPLVSNLADPITQALENSEYLIVICTPRLPESRWCNKEIDTFIKLRGRDKVFAILAEGEPQDSFPEQLKYAEEEIINEAGEKEIIRRELEPLAADVRGNSKAEIKKKMRSELLRLIAPMFGLNYDDLKQRHKEQRMKRVLRITAFAAGAFLAFGTFSTILSIQIQHQSDLISKQNEEIKSQSAQIEAQCNEVQSSYSRAMAGTSTHILEDGDRMAALYVARQALPSESENSRGAYTPEAEFALSQAISEYSSQRVLGLDYVIEVPMCVNGIGVSEDQSKAYVYDKAGGIIVWESATGKELARINTSGILSEEQIFIYGSDDLYFSDDIGVHHYIISSHEDIIVENRGSITQNRYGKYIVYTYSEAICRECGTDNKVLEIPVKYGINFNTETAFFNDASSIGVVEADDDKQTLTIYDLNSGECLHTIYLGEDEQSKFFSSYGKIYSFEYDYSKAIYVTTTLSCYDIETGEREFKKEIDRSSIHTIDFCDIADNRYLFMNSSNGIFVLDAQTGEEKYSHPMKDLVCAQLLNNSLSWELVTEDGEISVYSIEEDEIYDVTELVCDLSMRVQQFYWSKDFALVASKDRNIVVVYSKEELSEDRNIMEVDYSLSLMTTNSQGTYALYGDYDTDIVVLYDLSKKEAIKTYDEVKEISDYDFIGDSEDKFVITGENGFSVFTIGDDTKTYSFETQIKSFGDGKLWNDGRYFIYPFLDDEGNDFFNVYSTSTNELIGTVFDDTYRYLTSSLSADAKKHLKVDLSQNTCMVYRMGEDEPYYTLKADISGIQTAFFSDDNKYICIGYESDWISIYNAETFEEEGNVYCKDTDFPQKMKYLSSIQRYAIIMNKDSVILNSNLEKVACVDDFREFDDENGYFIQMSTWNCYRTKYLVYDELIKKADTLLEGYEPSSRVKREYSID